MDVSKYVETGNKIKTTGLKLQSIVDSDFKDRQGQEDVLLNKDVNNPSNTLLNPGIAVVGIIFILIIGTFILLHFC